MSVRVLLVEDDAGVAGALAESLHRHGHVVTSVGRGADALRRHRDGDLMLLDLGLPDLDGMEVLRKLRDFSAMPVIVLTARGDQRSVVRCFDLGANDYLTKPIRIGELVARIRNATRGQIEGPPHEDVVRIEDIEIDLAERRVRVAGRRIVFTTKEFDILAVLADPPGAAVSRRRIMDKVWGDGGVAHSRSLDVHITQIRSKLDRPGLLQTIRGYGYRFGRD